MTARSAGVRGVRPVGLAGSDCAEHRGDGIAGEHGLDDRLRRSLEVAQLDPASNASPENSRRMAPRKPSTRRAHRRSVPA